MLEGTVVQVIDHGTIVQVWVRTDDGGRHPVNFDHTPYRWLEEARGNIIGERVALREIPDHGYILEFLGSCSDCEVRS